MISISASSHLFAQEDFIARKYWGLAAGVNTIEIDNAFYVMDSQIPIVNSSNLALRYKRLAPTISFERFIERKENRFTNYSFRTSYSQSTNELFTYSGGFVEGTAVYELQNGKDPFIGRSDYKPFTYFNLQGGIGFHRGIKNANRWNFIYGFNFHGGFVFEKYEYFDNNQIKDIEVQSQIGFAKIEFSMRLVHRFKNQTQVYFHTQPEVLTFATGQESESDGDKTGIVDFYSNLNLSVFQIGFLSPLK